VRIDEANLILGLRLNILTAIVVGITALGIFFKLVGASGRKDHRFGALESGE